MKDTQLVFVLGSGRCGTKAIVKMLAGAGIEAHHEYCRYSYQREAVLTYIGKYEPLRMALILERIFGSAAYYSEQPIFLDSSHKLVPVVDVLTDMFPDAKFIHLIRDGRKVCESFFYKLQIHNDRAHRLLRDWITDPTLPLPPPSEKYWHIPAPYDDRWLRICWWWMYSNHLIEQAKNERFLTARLDTLINNEGALKMLVDFIGVDYDPTMFEFLQKPDHVYVPVNYSMTEQQQEQFDEICGSAMKYYGYTERENDVGYV